MKDMDLSTLNFGAPAAERDVHQGLVDYFVESAAFKRLVNREKVIVLGNRGSGKSALFKVTQVATYKMPARRVQLWAKMNPQTLSAKP